MPLLYQLVIHFSEPSTLCSLPSCRQLPATPHGSEPDTATTADLPGNADMNLTPPLHTHTGCQHTVKSPQTLITLSSGNVFQRDIHLPVVEYLTE